jgi:hypothetical protein
MKAWLVGQALPLGYVVEEIFRSVTSLIPATSAETA